MTGGELFEQAGRELAQRRIDASLALYSRAEQAGYDPDACAAARWECFMLAGNFASAWEESDRIARRGRPDPHRFWDGRPLAGRNILLRCLHGLGDTLQFIRYAPLIRKLAKSLTIEAQPKLKSLLGQAGLADSVITWGEPEPEWDQQVEVTELPRIFRTVVSTIPQNVPYLAGGEALPEEEMPDGTLRAGLVWEAGSYNRARSIPQACLKKLLRVSGFSFYNLQFSEEGRPVAAPSPRVQRLRSDAGQVTVMAEQLKQLDLLITVDTMSAHLAGAMGRPVWTLLPFAADWRWMTDRCDSPWYPSMRLFRQRQPDDWETVLDEVAQELWKISAQQSRQARRTGLVAEADRPGPAT